MGSYIATLIGLAVCVHLVATALERLHVLGFTVENMILFYYFAIFYWLTKPVVPGGPCRLPAAPYLVALGIMYLHACYYARSRRKAAREGGSRTH